MCLQQYIKYLYIDSFHFVSKSRNCTWVCGLQKCLLSFTDTNFWQVAFFLLVFISFLQHFLFSVVCYLGHFHSNYSAQDTISLWTNKRQFPSPQKLWSASNALLGKRGKEWGLGIWFGPIWVISLSSYGTVSMFNLFMLNAYLK